MASFAAQAELRSKWTDLVDFEVPGEVTSGVRSIVGWLKQASLEVQQAGLRTLNALSRPGAGTSPTMDSQSSITILHYNDVYNVESRQQEPVGGAARFCTAIKSFAHLNPLVLFSGDIFSPSILSTFTKGDQMLPVLKEVGTHCAVFGNHDFDFGLEKLRELILQTEFTWLMSNVIDQETGRPLGEGQITHVVQWAGKRIGLIGLVEKEWLDTLSTINPDEVIFLNYIEVGTKLGAQLKQEGCDLVIALTHMRTPNDVRLATYCDEIDLILGGHDHVYETNLINGKWIVKSGTDFRNFSKITLNFGQSGSGAFDINIERIDITSEYEEDVTLKGLLEGFSAVIESKMDEVLGRFAVPLDGRFECVRTRESNLGNWVCDVILAATGADLVIINSGTLRSDRIHPEGDFTMRDLTSVIPMMDLLVVLEVTGEQILQALENSVCMYPKLEGRFPQVAGMSFGFDPTRPIGERIDPRFVRIGDEYLEPDQEYRLATKVYLYEGRDGFTMFKDSRIMVDEDECPDIARAIQNHFQAIDIRLGKKRHSKHRQSLVTLSRRHSLVKLLDSSGAELDGPAPIRRRTSTMEMEHTPPSSIGSSGSSPHSGSHGPGSHKSTKTRMTRRASLVDLEQDSCELNPKIEGRIVILDEEKRKELLLERERLEASSVIMEAEEYSGPNEGTDPI